MHIIRVADQRAMPWKNGGGVTFEVAIFPAGATLDGFEWRVSMAQVETEGPFSRFAGIDRSLAVMQGSGLHLVVDGAPADLGPQSRPFVFSGDVPVSATLVDGPITDINVMTRRGAWRHRMDRETLEGRRALTAATDVTLAIVRSGTVRAGSEQLRPREALLLTAGERVGLASEAPADLFCIELARV